MLLTALTLATLPAISQSLPPGRFIFTGGADHVYRWMDDSMTGWPTPWPILGPLGGWAGDIAIHQGLLYVVVPYEDKIVRSTLDGTDVTTVLEGSGLYPHSLAFDQGGNLWFSTYDEEGSQDGSTQGIWRIENADPEVTPALIIGGDRLERMSPRARGYRFNVPPTIRFAPWSNALHISGLADCLVGRADPPGYDEIRPLIEFGDHVESPVGDFVFTPAGEILFADWLGGTIERYSSAGTWRSVFASVRYANRVAVDASGWVYVTGRIYRSGNEREVLTVFRPNGDEWLTIPLSDIFAVAVWGQEP